LQKLETVDKIKEMVLNSKLAHGPRLLISS